MQKNTVRQYTELSTKSPEGANATGIKQFRFTVPESIVIASGDSTTPPQVEVHDRSVTYSYSHLLPGGPADLEEKVIPYWFYHPGISPSAESYAPIVEKPFLSVAQQPLSTFGIDVDSASYSNVRRFIEQGQLPPPDAVRIEELINYFDYEYPEPTGTHPFSLNVETGVCPWAPEHLLAKIGLKAREVPRAERPLTNLVFLIDVSGSMQPSNKLPLVRESMKALLEALDERDRIAIVTYASGSSVALPSTPASDRATIATAIDRLHAGGSTHGSAGIQDAYRIARENFLPEGVNRVILATDGDFNVGVTDPDALVRKIEEQRQSGVFLTALGFGMGNLKDATLEQLADKGNGNYAYIDDFSEARKVLVEELMGTLVTVAKDVKIQVEFNPAQVQAYRLLGYENRMMAAQDFNDDRKDAGEIGAGHTVTALYEIVPLGAPVQPGVDPLRYQEKPAPPAPAQLGEPGGAPGTAAPATPVQEGFLPPTPQTNELMLVKLRYKQPDADNGIRFEQPVPVQRIAVEETSPDFRFAAAVAAFGLSLRHSQYAGNADLGMAQDLAQSPLNASSAMTSEERQERRAFADLVVSAKTLGQR
ncbi:MAG: VWA domain-containing protein [Candidatus Hydrogenedentes bacterium]|nr:VWA domain-containing protein [Candidatus Hydrogenedentota bacterium]